MICIDHVGRRGLDQDPCEGIDVMKGLDEGRELGLDSFVDGHGVHLDIDNPCCSSQMEGEGNEQTRLGGIFGSLRRDKELRRSLGGPFSSIMIKGKLQTRLLMAEMDLLGRGRTARNGVGTVQPGLFLLWGLLKLLIGHGQIQTNRRLFTFGE